MDEAFPAVREKGGVCTKTRAAKIAVAVAFAVVVAIGGTARAVIVIAPGEVRPGDGYAITVTAQASESGSLALSDDARQLANLEFFTDTSGVYVYRDIAPNREVTLSYRIVMNRSGSWTGSIVVVAEACTTANTQDCLGFLRGDLYRAVAQLGFVIALVLLVLNAPAMVAAMSRYRKDAALRGGATLRELAKAPLSTAWTILSPSRQIPDTMPTERVAVELKRREALAELVSVAKNARTFEYDRHIALVQATQKVVRLYNLEKSILKRRDRRRGEEDKGKSPARTAMVKELIRTESGDVKERRR